MEAEGLAASTRSTIISTIRSVQPGNKALAAVHIKVPHRSVQEEVLSKGEIQRILEDLRVNEDWYYPCFAVWLGTGLRNAELIGLTWDCVRLEEGELLITKTLRRDGVSNHKRTWGGTQGLLMVCPPRPSSLSVPGVSWGSSAPDPCPRLSPRALLQLRT